MESSFDWLEGCSPFSAVVFQTLILWTFETMGSSFFRIPKVKDDAMRIVCVLLNIFFAGMVLPILVIFRYWNHCRWHLGRKGYRCYSLRRCSADSLLLRYWLRLELDLGYLHCDAEAGVLNKLCVMFVGTLFCLWKIVFWLVLVFKVSRHGIRRL